MVGVDLMAATSMKAMKVPLVAQWLLGLATLVVALAVWQALTPLAEAPLAFGYLSRPRFNALPVGPASLPASIPPPDFLAPPDAEVEAARVVAQAFVADVQTGDFAAAWRRFEVEAREATPEPVWGEEQQVWLGATGPAPNLALGQAVAYPSSPNRLAFVVAAPEIEAVWQAWPGGLAQAPQLALEMVKRDGRWWVAKPVELWADGSPARLKSTERAGLGWLRYPLRLLPLPEDRALIARAAELPPLLAAPLTDLAVDARPLFAVENPLYDPRGLAPALTATWTLPPGVETTRDAVHSHWAELLRNRGWEVHVSPLRVRAINPAGSIELQTRPFGERDGRAPVRQQVLRLTETFQSVPDPTAALTYRRTLAQLGVQADIVIAMLPLPQPIPGAAGFMPPPPRLLPSPGDPGSTATSTQGDIGTATFVYYFDRAQRAPVEWRSYFAAALGGAQWPRERGGEVGFRTPDGQGRLYITGFEDTTLRRLAGFTLHPNRFVLVYVVSRAG